MTTASQNSAEDLPHSGETSAAAPDVPAACRAHGPSAELWRSLAEAPDGLFDQLDDRSSRELCHLLCDVLQHANIGIHCVAADGTILWANRAELELLGYAPQEYVGHNIAEFHVEKPVVEEILSPLLANQALQDRESRVRCKDGTVKDVLLNASAHWDNGEFRFIRCFTRENTERKRSELTLKDSRAERELQVQARTSELRRLNTTPRPEVELPRRAQEQLELLSSLSAAIATAADFDEALRVVLMRICQANCWAAAEAWLPAADRETLEPSPVWYRSSESSDPFRDVTLRLRFARGEGLPGHVWNEKRSVWIPDLQATQFPRAPAAAAAGFRAAAGVPVMAGDEVVAVMVFLIEQPREDDPHLVNLATTLASQLGNLFQQKRAEEQLQRRDRQLVEAQHMARMGSWEWDIPRDVMRWSEELYAIFGLSPGEVTASFEGLLKLVHPADRAGVEETMRRALDEGQSFAFDMRVIRGDGAVRSLHSEGHVTRQQGQALRAVGFAQDVTERKETEEVLSVAAALVAASDDAIIGKTLDGTIYSWNNGAQRIFGYTAEEVIGRSISILFPPGREEELKNILDRIRRGSSVLQYETIRLRKNGQPVNIQLTVSPIRNRQGAITGASVIGRDITDRKRLEGLVLEISERVQRRIGQDLHDGLSQQLSGIAYLSHLLVRKLRTKGVPESEDAARIIALVTEASEQARAVARGLLPVKAEPRGLMVALERLASTVESAYGIECWFVCEPKLHLHDNTIAIHLYRIAQEAVHNAIKHGQPDEVVIQLARHQDRIELSVQDNGSGFPTDLPEGRGMGLETMKYRARTIGAQLDFLAGTEKGTRVVCSLRLPETPHANDSPTD